MQCKCKQNATQNHLYKIHLLNYRSTSTWMMAETSSIEIVMIAVSCFLWKKTITGRNSNNKSVKEMPIFNSALRCKIVSVAVTGGVRCKKVFLKRYLRPATLLKKRLWHRFFPVNFAEFLKTHFLRNTSGGLLLHMEQYL